MKTSGKVSSILSLCIVFVIAGSIGNTGIVIAKGPEQTKTDRAIESKLIETSRNINRQLPMMVDSETRLDTTICNGKQMFYKYTMVNRSENEFDKKEFKNLLTASLIKSQCNDKTLLNALKMGVEYYFMYLDKDGNLITTINISKMNCGIR